MINRTKQSKNTIKQLAIRLFLAQSSNPKSLQILLLLTEFILFTYFVSSKYADPLKLTQFVDYNVLIGFSVAFIIARLLFRLTLVRILYLPCIFVINDGQNLIIYTIIISITLLINISSEITSRIQFQFVSHNPYSQSLNITKIFHYIIMIFSTCLRVNSPKVIDKSLQWIPDLIILVLFIGIFIIKFTSHTVSKFVKQVFLRFYLLCIVYYVRDLSANWIHQLQQNYIDFIVIVVSQILYFLMVLYQKRKQVKNQISNRSVVGTVFSILAYHFNQNYDETLEKMQNQLFFSQPQSIVDHPPQQTINQIKIRTTLNTHNMSILNYKILQMHTNRSFINTKKLNGKQKSRKNKSNNLSQLKINKDISKKISQKCLELLKQAYEEKNDNLYNCKFLIIQIKFYLEGNFLVAKKFVDDLQVHCSKLSFIKRICLYKLKKKIEKTIIEKSITKCELNYQEFFSNQNLRNQIIKNSLQYLQLWNYMVNPDFLFEKITKLLNKVLKRQKSIQQIYKKIRVKCHSIIILYANYMYMVRRDVQHTLQLSRNLQIFRQSLTELNISNKIYISVMLQKQNQLCFQNVGYNIKLLGYNKSEVKKSKVSILLPSFFASYHEQLMRQDLNHNNQGLVVYNKNTYVKHYQGYFLPVLLNLRIFYNKQGNLISQGYIQIQQNFRYNWKNYFILKQSEEQIIQIGPILQQHLILPSNKFHHAGDYFQANVGDKSRQRYYYSQEGFYQYLPIQSFWVKDQRYQLCVQDNFSEGRSFQTITTNNENYTQKYETMKYEKFAVNYQDHSTNLSEYFNLKNQTMLKISKKTPIIIFIIVILLFFICIGLVGFLVQRVEVVNQSSLSIMTDLSNLLEFYHNLQNFGINLQKVLFQSYKKISFYYGYYTHQEICLNLQEKNTLLAKFDTKIYGYARPQANFQPKALNILISDMVANCFTSLYFKDTKILSQNFRNLHILYEFIWSSTVDDYLKVCLETASQVTDIDNVYKLVLGIFIGIAILAIYILMIKIRNIDRQFQFYILDLFSYVNSNFIFINSINAFLRMTINCIPDSEVQFENKKHYRRNSVAGCNTSRMQLISSVSAREISVKQISGKQNSARGLFQQSAIYKNVNRNAIITKNASLPQNTIELQEKIQQNEEQRKQKKTSPHSKLYLFLWTLVFLLTLSVLVSNIIMNQSQSKIGISKSLKSLLILLNKQLVFSSTVICYLDSVGTNGNFSMFKTNYNRFDTLQKDMATFEEVILPQFNKFSLMLKNFNFVYLCDYIECNENNSKEFNISYGSAIEKFNNYMITNMNIKITDQNFNQNIQLLFDAHYLLQNTFYQLIKTYLQNYKTFQTNKLKILLIFYYCQFIVFFVFMSSAFVQYCCYFVKNKKKYLEVLNLIKQESYNMHILQQHEAE